MRRVEKPSVCNGCCNVSQLNRCHKYFTLSNGIGYYGRPTPSLIGIPKIVEVGIGYIAWLAYRMVIAQIIPQTKAVQVFVPVIDVLFDFVVFVDNPTVNIGEIGVTRFINTPV